jgi:hypothetical protein
MRVSFLLLLLSGLFSGSTAWTTSGKTVRNSVSVAAATTTSTWFSGAKEETLSLDQVKAQVLQLGAALDRGQAYNPTSGSYYEGTMNTARSKIQQLLEASPDQIPTKLEDIAGEWELVLSTVPHGIFRSSPFFLAIQESYEFAEEKGTSL